MAVERSRTTRVIRLPMVIAHDAFDLLRILDHGGDTRSAIKAAAEALGMGSPAGEKAQGGGQTAPSNGGSPAVADDGEVVHRCLFDIEAKPIRWLWQGRIARGKVTIVAGHPDLGKSQVTASMAAVVTTGGAWPVDQTPCERGAVIVLSAEDIPEDTIRPRFEAAGADLKRVEILDAIRQTNKDGTSTARPFNLGTDIARLRTLARELGDVALIVIDPITAYLGRVDSHRNAEVRAVLAPLGEMAAEIGAAIVCVSHLNKAGGTEALLRVMGSLGFVAAARGAYLVAKDPGDETRRLFLPMKNNLAEDRGGLAFRVKGKALESGIATSCVEWDAEKVTMTADEAMAPAGDPEERSATDEAMDWLRDRVANGGAEAGAVQKEARQVGISDKALRRAREKLGIKPRKRDFAGGWWWEINPAAQGAQDAYTQNVGTLGGEGHLGAPSDAESDIEEGSL